MSNPSLQRIRIAGGPLDGKRVSVLPDDGGSLPRRIQIVQDGEVTSTLRGQVVDKRQSELYLLHSLYMMVGSDPERTMLLCYVYERTLFVPVDADTREISKTSVSDT